ncbi:MAG: hypothetical protein SFX72_12055 [Isosphaeraceae bacterium]|nr:hypothetical protein [Isosphaeraceae bacterium]
MSLCAYFVHCFALCDALEQAAFPGFGRWGPRLAGSVGLGASSYLPAFLAGSLLACPVPNGERGTVLVDLTAYRSAAPRRGDAVWVGSRDGASSRIARVLATPDQEVTATHRGGRVDGRSIPSGWMPDPEGLGSLEFRVPEGHVLVVLDGDSRGGAPWELVERERLRGRAWARTISTRGRFPLE